MRDITPASLTYIAENIAPRDEPRRITAQEYSEPVQLVWFPHPTHRRHAFPETHLLL